MSMKLSRFTGGKQSPTIRRFARAFIRPFSEIFSKVQFGPRPAVKRSSYYTEIFSPFLYAFAGIFLRFSNLFSQSGKRPPTIRIKNRRFLRVFFKKFTKSSKIHHRRKRFPYYTQKNTLLLRQSRERFFIFSSHCLIRKKILLLYAQKAGVLIAISAHKK